jgi:hypothetical protein
MKERLPMLVMIGRGLLFFLVYPVGFGVGVAIMLQIVNALVEPPFRIPVAMVAFVAYIYVFGRWVLRLKARPLLAERSKQKLRRIFGAVGPTRQSSRTLRDKTAQRR